MNTKHQSPAICILVSIVVLGCSLVSSAAPTSSLLAPEEISRVELGPVLWQAGDLPKDYEAGNPTTTVPERYQKLPTAKKQLSVKITRNGSWAGDVTIFLFDKQADMDKGFQSYTGKSPAKAEGIAGMGEKSVFIPFSVPYSGGTIDGADLMFMRCSALVDIRLITNETDEVRAFAERLDSRLTPLVCKNAAQTAPEASTPMAEPVASPTAVLEKPDSAASNAGGTYLSEIHPTEVVLGYGTYSVGTFAFSADDPADRIHFGDPLMIHGVRYPHGIFAHAPSVLVYEVGDRQPDRFSATLGLVEWINCGNGVEFVVRLDGREVYRSQTLFPGSQPTDMEVAIDHGSKLSLVVEDRGDKDCDWAVWGDPRIR